MPALQATGIGSEQEQYREQSHSVTFHWWTHSIRFPAFTDGSFGLWVSSELSPCNILQEEPTLRHCTAAIVSAHLLPSDQHQLRPIARPQGKTRLPPPCPWHLPQALCSCGSGPGALFLPVISAHPVVSLPSGSTQKSLCFEWAFPWPPSKIIPSAIQFFTPPNLLYLLHVYALHCMCHLFFPLWLRCQLPEAGPGSVPGRGMCTQYGCSIHVCRVGACTNEWKPLIFVVIFQLVLSSI